jgi:hypothetical protein
MKAYIIESQGITRTRVKVATKTVQFGDLKMEFGDFELLDRIKMEKSYCGKKVLRAYRSAWGDDTFFVRHFI